MKITIDTYSGFCFGVVYAIEMAESILKNEGSLYCLGDIVHNNKEVERLNALGLKIIDHNDLHDLKDCKVLIRAHGEPPSTYELALKNNIQLLDASCPVVLKLQHQIKGGYEEIKQIDGQVIIFGKQGHAEVVGLLGQTNNSAIVVASFEDFLPLTKITTSFRVENCFNWGSLPETCLHKVSFTMYFILVLVDIFILFSISKVMS